MLLVRKVFVIAVLSALARLGSAVGAVGGGPGHSVPATASAAGTLRAHKSAFTVNTVKALQARSLDTASAPGFDAIITPAVNRDKSGTTRCSDQRNLPQPPQYQAVTDGRTKSTERAGFTRQLAPSRGISRIIAV